MEALDKPSETNLLYHHPEQNNTTEEKQVNEKLRKLHKVVCALPYMVLKPATSGCKILHLLRVVYISDAIDEIPVASRAAYRIVDDLEGAGVSD